MLNHLLTLSNEPLTEAASSFVDEENAEPDEILNGKINTDEWLKNLGAEDAPSMNPALENALAAQAFGALTGAQDVPAHTSKREQVLALRTPEAVRKTVNMLTEYEYSFVQHAHQMRTYIIDGLMRETQDVKPEVRLKAYKMLGEVTEVALFTTRTEIVTKNLTDEQVEDEIKKRLERLIVNPDTPLVQRVDSEVDDE
jgi:hypothetical protein